MSIDYTPVLSSGADPRLRAPEATRQGTRPRLGSIDVLRGLVMIVMALDHTRDFFGSSGMNPRDVADPALFLTRWITHFCAPNFIFLAGISAYLYGTRGHSTAELSRFLITRGFWLIVLEFTLVRFAWSFGFGTQFFAAQVIFAIGASMVMLAGLVWLPRAAVAAALVMIAGHNLADSVHAADFGKAGWLWAVLHEPKLLSLSAQTKLYVLYPLIPWVGVMAAGFALGPQFERPMVERRRLFLWLGATVTVGFVALQAFERLRRSGALGPSGDGAIDTLLSVHQCREVSAVAALPDDDARPGAPAACRLRDRDRTHRGVGGDVRTRASVLLRGPRRSYPHSGGRGGASDARQLRLG